MTSIEEAADVDALSVGMAIVPGLYSRNRMFALFNDPNVQRSRRRAALMRGLVRQLSGGMGPVDILRFERPASESSEGRLELRFRIPGYRLERHVDLSGLEVACIMHLCARLGVVGMEPTDVERRLLEVALDRLLQALPLASVGLSSHVADVARSASVAVGSAVMSASESCLFCRIVRREIQAAIVFENDHVLAFRDIRPVAPTHILVIPKRHVASIAECSDEDRDVFGHVVTAIRDVARREGLDEGGYRAVVNNGENAGQSVFHVHFHVLGGRPMAWPPG